jgi:predicted component of type VI protein secretion system
MDATSPEQSTSWWLTVRKGPQAGTVYPLRGTSFTIGRQPDNYVVIDDPMVSRHHARFSLQGDSYVLEDLGSANGTWVNNIRLASPVVLRPGDVIGLGQEVILAFGDHPGYGPDVTAQASALTQFGPAAAVGHAMAAPEPAAEPLRRRFPSWLAFLVGAVLTTIAVGLVVAVVLVLQGQPAEEVVVALATNTATATATLTSAPTYTPYPTYTAAPTYTPIPTSAPTYTPYPTYTPIPTSPPTYTPYPTFTPFPTSPPTYTPYPTYTPAPTNRPAPRAQPTDTPRPTDTPSPPPFTVSINKAIYEPWGRPTNPDGCSPPYNDKDPVRRFTVEFVVTNQSNRYIPDQWHPHFYSAKGDVPEVCVWYYDNTAIEPGETTYVTFATHVESDDWVQAMVLDEIGYEVIICLNAAGQIVACR